MIQFHLHRKNADWGGVKKEVMFNKSLGVEKALSWRGRKIGMSKR